ncbi:hypothetical protein [Paenibacillus lentus]|uniref:Uncharacterized protein n=1 Tax=Paenibacillus lentus TaxID=1338368 RepID=A0A3S8RYG6_9BACL|nr:hypothetical protein [Paenibacillus lentus]AZK47976.1 hypothetical protein EIM92_18875 [Paenibacillus lentus]
MFLYEEGFILVLVPVLLLSFVACSEKGSDSGAHKPSLMYDGALYSISPEKNGTFNLDDRSKLQLVGVIEEAVDGTKVAEKDMQISGIDELVGCNVYLSKDYPQHIFVLDNEANFVAFIKE